MKIKRFALAVAFLSIAVLSRPVSSGATGLFNQYAGFGDSTLDSGYFRYNTTGSATQDAEIAAAVAAGASGAFVGPGVMNSTMLAARFGLNGRPIGGGGFNFANGGAFSAPLRASDNAPALSGVSALTNVATDQQIQNYLASVGGPQGQGRPHFDHCPGLLHGRRPGEIRLGHGLRGHFLQDQRTGDGAGLGLGHGL